MNVQSVVDRVMQVRRHHGMIIHVLTGKEGDARALLNELSGRGMTGHRAGDFEGQPETPPAIPRPESRSAPGTTSASPISSTAWIQRQPGRSWISCWGVPRLSSWMCRQ